MGIDAVLDWLMDGAPGASTSEAVVTRMAPELRAAGIPVDRVLAYVTTLHPSIVGRAFLWLAEAPEKTVVRELPHTMTGTVQFQNSPIRQVIEGRVESRTRIDPNATTFAVPLLEELAQEGYRDYFILPIIFTNGQVHAISFATKTESGFDDAAISGLRKLLRPLTRIAEILALRRTAATLLTTYVGRNSGERILAGRVQKGDFETIRAVIWCSDLRGFTSLSSRASAREVIDTLNRVFECQVPAIEKRGGEILKFMGDGLLAIFPLAEGDDAAQAADAAFDAGHEAMAAVAAIAATPPLRIGLALHIGELAYGNIGGSNRLDFTAIGPAVNIASRLEGLTSRLGKPLVVSEDFARATKRSTEELGTFELKGIPTPLRVFAPLAAIE